MTQDVDILASFPSSFPSLAVRVGSYCKLGEGSKAIDVQLPTPISRSSRKHGIFFVCQRCRTLVVNYFRCASGTLPVRSGPGFNEGPSRRTTVEQKQNVKFNLSPTVHVSAVDLFLLQYPFYRENLQT